jgi:hypothetical protein
MRRRLVRIASPFAAAILTVAMMAFIAGAHDTDVMDNNDVRGKLDMQKVRLRHQPGPPFWTIVTFQEWSPRDIWDRGYLMIFLDTTGGPPADYFLLIRSTGPALEGSLWRVRGVGPDTRLATVPVVRQSRRSASIQVGLRRLEFGAKRAFYRWWAQTIVTNDVCRRTCQDRAPNGDENQLQWRPGMSPSPSADD